MTPKRAKQVAALLVVDCLCGGRMASTAAWSSSTPANCWSKYPTAMPWPSRPRPSSGGSSSQQAAEQGGLAAAVGAQQAPALAAGDLHVDAGEEPPAVGLAKPLGADDDVAGAGGGGKRHRRGGDLPRRRHELDPLQLLAAVLRLGVLLP